MYLRIPSWAGGWDLTVNGEPLENLDPPTSWESLAPTASGYDPRAAHYLPVRRTWAPGDRLELALSMPLTVRRPHRKVASQRGRVALSRGPLVYCLESVDNPGMDLFRMELDVATFEAGMSPEQFGGITVLRGRTRDGRVVTAIPYALWANRGQSQMTVLMDG
jgi:hypothetical protein